MDQRNSAQHSAHTNSVIVHDSSGLEECSFQCHRVIRNVSCCIRVTLEVMKGCELCDRVSVSVNLRDLKVSRDV